MFVKILILFFPFILLGSDLFQETSLKGGIGYREDSLNWNIADSSGTPNVLSELEWYDLQAVNYYLKADVIACESIYLKAEGDYAKIFHGINKDSDYSLDNRQGLYSVSKNSAKKGELFDLSCAIGYQWTPCLQGITLVPQIGYSLHEQHLRQFNGNQTYYNPAFDPGDPVFFDITGPFPGLHSNFRARWMGPWIGCDVKYEIDCYKLLAGFEYHGAHYKGTGHWNLRPDFAKDFVHKGWGRGFTVKFEAETYLTSCLTFGIQTSYTNFKLKNGTDHTFFFDDDVLVPPGEERPILVGVTRLNQVNWHSFVIQGTLAYYF